MAAELDYAFVAEFAKVDHGALTAVGASYTEVLVKELPVGHMLCVAGRIRTQIEDPQPELTVTMTPPGKKYRLEATGELPRDENAVPYSDKIGYVFVLTTPLQLDEAGEYVVNISLDGEPVRRLIFTVVLDSDSTS